MCNEDKENEVNHSHMIMTVIPGKIGDWVVMEEQPQWEIGISSEWHLPVNGTVPGL